MQADTVASALGMGLGGMRFVFSTCSSAFKGYLIWVTFNCLKVNRWIISGGGGGFTSKRSGVQGRVLCCCFFFRIKRRETELVGKLNYFSWESSRQWLRFLLSCAFYLRLFNKQVLGPHLPAMERAAKGQHTHRTEVLLFRWRSSLVDYSQGFDSHCSCFRKFILSSRAGLLPFT